MPGYNNIIYKIIAQLYLKDISDIHFSEDWTVYVRDSIWEMKLVTDISIEKEEIRGLVQDHLSAEKMNQMLDGEEIDFAVNVGNWRFRVNAYLDSKWICLALRKINTTPARFSDIALSENLKKYLLKEKWLILVTGPTGSWKTTTISAMLDFINENRACHIITMEDPIEYIYQSKKSRVVQREIWKNSKSWSSAMKYVLRQDPDVIMVWEMRDLESISAALTLVETWHLVLSTLHTTSASQTITRIIDVFPPDQQEQIALQLSLALSAIVSQRLVPRKNKQWKVAVREILFNNSWVANLIREKKIPQLKNLLETSSKEWMESMDLCLAKMFLKWMVDLDTITHIIDNVSTFKSTVKTLQERWEVS